MNNRVESLSGWVSVILRSPVIQSFARLALTSAFWIGGLQKLLDFAGAAAEQIHFGLPVPHFLAALTIAIELIGSALVVTGYRTRLGATVLGLFTLVATLIAHRFWELQGMERFMSMNTFFEHMGLIGGLVLAAVLPAVLPARVAAMPSSVDPAPRPPLSTESIASDSVSIPTLLAFTAGFTDTVGFLALFGLFTAHVTGNFVVLGAALVDHHHGLIAKLLALPTFIVGVALARVIERALRRRSHDPAPPLLMLQATLLLIFLIFGLAAFPVTDADAPIAIAAGLCGVFAMAVQNAVSRTVFAKLSPTTVMTGNVTQLTLDAVDLAASARGAERSEARARLAKMGPPVIGFAIGAGLGGMAFVYAGFWCLLVAIAVVLVTILSASRRSVYVR